MYIYVMESDKDCGSETRLYRSLENAKRAVAKTYDEYLKSGNYSIGPADRKEAEKDYEENCGLGFTVALDNGGETLRCHVEEIGFAD